MGEEELGKVDQAYLQFGNRYEREFVTQSFHEDRSMEDSLALGWKLISMLPKTELSNLREEEIEKYYIAAKEE